MGQDRINREERRDMDFQKNQLLTTEIIDISTEGEGIGKVNGYPFFIKDTIIGDQVEIRAIKLKKNYGYGKIREGDYTFSFSCNAVLLFSQAMRRMSDPGNEL